MGPVSLWGHLDSWRAPGASTHAHSAEHLNFVQCQLIVANEHSRAHQFYALLTASVQLVIAVRLAPMTTMAALLVSSVVFNIYNTLQRP